MNAGVFGYEFTVARRHVQSLRSRHRITVSAAIAITGIAIGVAALVIVLSVMNGYAEVVKDRLLGVNAHMTIRRPYSEPFANDPVLLGQLAGLPDVLGVSPYVQAEGFVLHKPPDLGLRRAGVMVRGVTEAGLISTTSIGNQLESGNLDFSEQSPGVYGVVLGRHVARKLGASTGSELHLSTMPTELMLGQMPALRRYVVTGIFASGYYEFDAGLILVPLAALQRDLEWGDVLTGVRVRVQDPFEVDRVAREARSILAGVPGGLFASTWQYEHGNLYAWIRMQKWFSFIALSLIVVVAGFNLISILTMSVIERRREIGILKAMGAPSAKIGRIFTLEGLAIGIAGILVGDLLGITLCTIQQAYEVIGLRGDVYFIDALPVRLQVSDFLIVSLSTLVLCYVFTRFPARDAATMAPVDAIRSE